MAQRDLFEIFEDCTNRLNHGQSVEECLRLYPETASQLRPLLEVAAAVQDVQIPPAEVLEDQEIVWTMLDQRFSDKIIPFRRRFNVRLQLLIALMMLLVLLLGTWFFLSRLDIDDRPELIPMVESATDVPTITSTNTPSPTFTLDLRDTATQRAILSATSAAQLTSTPTLTLTSSPTYTLTPTRTPSPTSTMEKCTGPLELIDVIVLVEELHPDTTITHMSKISTSDYDVLWSVETSDGLMIMVDALCGEVLATVQKQRTSTPTLTKTSTSIPFTNTSISVTWTPTPAPMTNVDQGASEAPNIESEDHKDVFSEVDDSQTSNDADAEPLQNNDDSAISSDDERDTSDDRNSDDDSSDKSSDDEPEDDSSDHSDDDAHD